MLILAAACLVACSPQDSPASQQAIDRAVAAAMDEIDQARRVVTCRRKTDPAGFACIQAMDNDSQHFAILTVSALPLRGSGQAKKVEIDSVFVGPGGASTRFVGRTPDQLYEIVVTDANRMSTGDQSQLPTPAALISRINVLYAHPAKDTI